MTIKEISELTGLSYGTIRKKIKDLYPNIIKNGKKTYLKKEETINVVAELRKKGFIQPTENLEVAPKNSEVAPKNSEVDRLDRLESLVEKLIEIIPKMINNNVKQIEIRQDYYSILGYCRMKNIELSFSDAIHYGKEATRISKEKNIDIRKISDERFGFVNSYSVNVLEKVFEL